MQPGIQDWQGGTGGPHFRKNTVKAQPSVCCQPCLSPRRLKHHLELGVKDWKKNLAGDKQESERCVQRRDTGS